MQYETAAQMAERLNVNIRTVQVWAKEGKLPGAIKQGRDWLIPEGEGKPNKSRDTKNMAMPRKSPFLDMTDLYHTPGKADECAEALCEHKEAQALFKAEIAYSRGEIDKVYKYAQYFLNERSGFYAIIAGGMLLSLCAMWRGDVELWRKAKQHICEAPWKNDNDRDIIALSLASSDSSIRDTDSFPDWFCRGQFWHLPKDAYPAARVFYIKYLMVAAQELAKGSIELDGVKGLGLIRTLPYIIEPMIAQAVIEKTVMVEIYLRLLCAIAYHDMGDDGRAREHIDRAVQLALPDMLLGALAEHRRQLDYLLDDCLAKYSPDALKKLRDMHKTLAEGWHILHNAVLDKNVSTKLSIREREIARLAAFGLSNSEIATRLNISQTSVKSVIVMAINKTGARNRHELGGYI